MVVKSNIEVVPERVLIEYQKAQDSAEHYDNLMWTLISVGIGFSLTILYTVNVNKADSLVNLCLLFIGAFALFYFSNIIETSNEKKDYKYKICKDIEKKYNFIGQNLGVVRLPIYKMKTNFGITSLRIMKFLIFFLYLASYIIILINLWKNNTLSQLILFTAILFILAIVLSLIMELIYLKVSTKENG